MRLSLGASTWQLFRLLLTEPMLLALCGLLTALLFGKGLVAIVGAVIPEFAHAYRLVPAELSVRVLILVLMATAAALLVFGVLPAVSVIRNTSAGVHGTSTRTTRTRKLGDSVLTALQAAVSVSILVTALLLVGSFGRLLQSIKGIDLSGLTSVVVELPRDAYGSSVRVHQFASEFVRRVEDATGLRLAQSRGTPGLTLPGPIRRAEDARNSRMTVVAYPADRTYLEAARLRLTAGRMYTNEEARSNGAVAIIDQKGANFLWPGQNPLGKLVRDTQSPQSPERVIVGIIQTVDLSFGGEATNGHAFVPLDPDGRSLDGFSWRGTLTTGLRIAIEDIARELEPRAPVMFSPMKPFERTLGEPRLLAWLLGVLATLAIGLTIAGVYSIVSHLVANRTAEIGVRMALGATRANVRSMVLRQSLTPTAIGIAIGLVACLWWTRTLKTFLFGFEPADVGVYSGAATLVFLVATIATTVPARRASRIDPVIALRAD